MQLPCGKHKKAEQGYLSLLADMYLLLPEETTDRNNPSAISTKLYKRKSAPASCQQWRRTGNHKCTQILAHAHAAVRAQHALLPTISARFTELYVRAALLWGGALDKHQRHL